MASAFCFSIQHMTVLHVTSCICTVVVRETHWLKKLEKEIYLVGFLKMFSNNLSQVEVATITEQNNYC